MLIKIIVTITLLIFTVNSYAVVTVEDYQKMRTSKDTSSKERIERYIDGVLNGIDWTNVIFKSLRHQELYCMPKNFALNVDNAFQIIDDQIKKNPPKKGTPADMLLVIGLMEMFPCE